MSSTLLKLYNSSGDLDVMTTAEEAYVAYQAAVWLASNMGTASNGAINVGTAVSPQRAVGSYVNTFYNQAVGTHPGSSLSTGTTTTTLRQLNDGDNGDNAASTNFRRPATWDTTNSGIKELTDAEMNTVCDRLLAYIMVNEWSGANFRLGTSAPAGYTSFIANFASDTQSSGVTAATYSIYKKTTTPTAPTAARPVCLKRATYPSGTYSGITEMSDAQIAATFGSWIMARMVSADDHVGRYLLTTSTPAGLGYTGTWQSRGSMVDTRDTTTEVDYSATYSGNYTTGFVGDYVGNYVGDYIGTVVYSGNYTRNSTTNFTRNSFRYSTAYGLRYQGNWTGDFVGDFTGDFVGNYTNPNVNFAGTYSATYSATYTGDFVGNYVGNYVGTTLSSTDATINTYTLYTRVA